MVSHALQVFAGHAHSGGKCADNTITCFVNGVEFFTAKNALRQSLAELSDNRTRFLSISPRKFKAGRNSFGNFQNFVRAIPKLTH